jgi:hypothetical protein
MVSTIKRTRKKPKAIALRNWLINVPFRPAVGRRIGAAEICCFLLFAGHTLCPALLLAMPERTPDLGIAVATNEIGPQIKAEKESHPGNRYYNSKDADFSIISVGPVTHFH